jgi:hypothetical protein
MARTRMMELHSSDVTRYGPIRLECGSLAEFDVDSGIGYRCTECYAMVGSVAMPKRCSELYRMIDVVDKLKGSK